MDILKAYQTVAAEHGLPSMQHGGYRARSEAIATPEAAWNRLAALAPRQGWLLFQSEQRTFVNGLPERKAAWGVLLAAEACTECSDEPISIALEQDGAGGWTLTTYTHEATESHLWDTLEQLVHGDVQEGREKLQYRRYWRHDPQQGYVQAAACFVGFK